MKMKLISCSLALFSASTAAAFSFSLCPSSRLLPRLFPSRRALIRSTAAAAAAAADDAGDGAAAAKKQQARKRRRAPTTQPEATTEEGEEKAKEEEAEEEEEEEKEEEPEAYSDISTGWTYEPPPLSPVASEEDCAAAVAFLSSPRRDADNLAFVSAWGPLAKEMRVANGWSQGSYVISSATPRRVSSRGLVYACDVRSRGFFGKVTEERVEDVEVTFAEALLEEDSNVPPEQREQIEEEQQQR